MFESLTERLQSAFSIFTSSKTVTEDSIKSIIREVRLALLDADVNYGVVSRVIKSVKSAAVGIERLKGVAAQDQFISIVHDQLVALLGNEEKEFNLSTDDSVILLVGLQGSGKTTQAGKLAHYLKAKGKKPLLTSCDISRPAGVEQLKILASSASVEFYQPEKGDREAAIISKARKNALLLGCDVTIIDTAGRSQVSDEDMQKLHIIKESAKPSHTLFVASASLGQESVNIAKEFTKVTPITGSIVTMLDGTSRAGAALSIVEATNSPIFFEGNGEKIDDFIEFSPNSLADRILGMGDVVTLVKKAEKVFADEGIKAENAALMHSRFTFKDLLDQMKMMKKMGSLGSIIKMMPGVPKDFDLDASELHLKSSESIILSMTRKEKEGVVEFNHTRKIRLSKGSGRSLAEVNKLIKQQKQMAQMMKKMPKNKNKMSKMLGNDTTLFKGLKNFDRFFSE